jgi:hypothetical protein
MILERTGNPAYPYPVVFVDAVEGRGWSQNVAGAAHGVAECAVVDVDPALRVRDRALRDSISRAGADV